ncbi:hypothetical protein [Vreelandella sp. TE19]
MMIVELIDGDDFRARLETLGIALPLDADQDTCARIAASAHRQQPVDGLPAFIEALKARQDIVLPEVREAVERHLAFIE